jgi:hypothetical protein
VKKNIIFYELSKGHKILVFFWKPKIQCTGIPKNPSGILKIGGRAVDRLGGELAVWARPTFAGKGKRMYSLWTFIDILFAVFGRRHSPQSADAPYCNQTLILFSFFFWIWIFSVELAVFLAMNLLYLYFLMHILGVLHRHYEVIISLSPPNNSNDSNCFIIVIVVMLNNI